MYNPFLVWALKKCETGQAVDLVFGKYKITDPEKKIRYLGYCLGNPEFFFAGGVKKDGKEELLSQYLTVRSMFVTGSWR